MLPTDYLNWKEKKSEKKRKKKVKENRIWKMWHHYIPVGIPPYVQALAPR